MDESDESYEPILPDDLVPTAKPTAPAPLQRLWKAPAEDEDDELTARDRAKKAKQAEEPAPKPRPRPAKPKAAVKKKAEPPVDDGTGATKLEETPVLDTVEARQRARLLVGGLIAAVVVILGFIIKGAVGGGSDVIQEGEPPDPRSISDAKGGGGGGSGGANVAGEVEARNLLDNARQADRLGKTDAAVKLLKKVTGTYPTTAAAREALHALDRNRVSKPLFGDDMPEQAEGPKKPPETGSTMTLGSNTTPPASTTPPPTVTPKSENSKKTDTTPPTQTAPPPVVTPTVQIRALPSGYRHNFDAPIHPSGWPTRIFSDRDRSEMVLVPAGVFDMGRGDGEIQEAPVHPVGLSFFYIDQHEVTVRQYSRFLKDSGRPLDTVRKSLPKGIDPAAYEDYPIVGISWKEADAFCDWARRSLPTEAQWELAARSIDGRISYWNGELPRKDPEKGSRPMAAVMSLSSDVSPYGAFDLSANAWEWTADIYDSQYYQTFKNLVNDPTGPLKKSKSGLLMMSVRGGSKNGFLTWRDGLKVETRLPYLGFRGALSVEAPVKPPPGTGPTAPPAGRPQGGNAGPF